jgi:hypothetical protein
MRSWDFIGYVACSLVLLTFYMKDMVTLRIAALCSNVAFLTYGIALELMPVTLLHAALMPMNMWRLLYALRERECSALPPGPEQHTTTTPAAVRRNCLSRIVVQSSD